jgi:hypothetical protein
VPHHSPFAITEEEEEEIDIIIIIKKIIQQQYFYYSTYICFGTQTSIDTKTQRYMQLIIEKNSKIKTKGEKNIL